mgnify:CR=1 FL=1
MKDQVESCHLTKFEAFRVNRDQVMNLQTSFRWWCQIIDSLNFEIRPCSLHNFGIFWCQLLLSDLVLTCKVFLAATLLASAIFKAENVDLHLKAFYDSVTR